MKKILIFEDEARTADMIIRLLNQYDSSIKVLGILNSVKAGVEWFHNRTEDPDLMLMDFQLTGGNSFDLFEQIETDVPVIFITAYDEFAIRAFKMNSLDYLLKPITYADLSKALQKVSKMAEALSRTCSHGLADVARPGKARWKQRFLTKIGDQYPFIATSSIAFFFYEDGMVFAQLTDGNRVMVDQSLDELEKVLDPEIFHRLNRQVVSAISSISSIHSYFNRRLSVRLNPGDIQVIVSRTRVDGFKTWLNN